MRANSCDLIQTIHCRVYSTFIFYIYCCRTYKQIAVNCRCDQYSLSHFRRKLEDCTLHIISNCLIQKHVFPFTGCDMKLSVWKLIIDLISINSCCINNKFCLDCLINTGICVMNLNSKSFSCLFQFFNFCIQEKPNTVLVCIFRISHCHMEWTNDSSGWSPQCTCHIICQVRLFLNQSLFV